MNADTNGREARLPGRSFFLRKSMQPGGHPAACLTAQAPPRDDGARNRGAELRIRIALSLGAFLLAGGALMGTAMATAAPAQVQPPTSTTAPAQAPPTAAPTRPELTPVPTTRKPQVAPGVAQEKAPGAVRVPRAIPAGPTGDLHLPAITEAN
jgi:hypothetical protein